MRESPYQRKLVQRLEREFPGCVVIRNDPRYIQGIPDLLILFGDKWAMLEVKVSATAEVQPNQEYYVEAFAKMSYSAFVWPDIEESVIHDLQHTFFDRGSTRLSQR